MLTVKLLLRNVATLHPVDLEEFKYVQSSCKTSENELDSPTLIQVSVTHRKSRWFEVKKPFRINVLLVSNLAFTRDILTSPEFLAIDGFIQPSIFRA